MVAPSMDWQAWFTLAIVLFALGAMVREVAAPDLIMMAALFSLAGTGILTPSETFAGFASPAVATVGILFVVSAALRETGAIDLTIGRVLRPAQTMKTGGMRIAPSVAALSAFLNNAPIVAMMVPTVIDWARRHSISPSRLLIPLSYSAILGSTMTIIGTSTNLTVAAMVSAAGMREMDFFELLPVGGPICLIGLVYVVLLVPGRLHDRKDPAAELGEKRREYTVTMLVEPEGPLVLKTVGEADLRQLPGLFLVEIERKGRVITPVGPDERLNASDLLVFAGAVTGVVDLTRIRGLRPATEEDEPDHELTSDHRLVEAVVSASSPLVGTSVRDSNFRTVYDAAVVAVHRNAERVPGKIGEIVLRPGDTLLLQCASGFIRVHGNTSDFYLVSELADTQPRRHDRAWVALSALVVMVGVAGAGLMPISIAAFLAAGFLIAARCITGPQARRSVDWSILIVIGAGLGIASAMAKTGAAATVAQLLVNSAGAFGPVAVLAVVYLVGLVMAEMLHHTAAVSIVFPIAMAAAAELGVDPRAFVIAVCISGCCAFASPVTYQTHLLVYGPGGYRYTDFVRAGLPLDLLCAVVALILIPIIWPL
jgi:di/tricarboxylate transporter